MIHDLKPYPVYKDSGVPWIGKVPEHWDVVPNRARLILKKKVVGTSSAKYTLLSLTKQGVIARDLENPEGKFPASFDTYQEVKSGDLIFCLFDIDETPRTVGLSTLEGMITGAYTVFECTDPEAARFIYLFYLAMDNSKHLKPLYTGLRKVITKSTFLSAKMPLPPSDEQFAIVRYLDHFDQRIRRYIHAKKKLIKLLEEQKQTIIHQVVTRGLDSNVKLKPSGVEWIEDVPEHWEVKRLKYLVMRTGVGIQMGPFGSSLTQLEDYDTGFKLYGQENTISGDFSRGKRWVTSQQFDALKRYELLPEDLVLTRKGSIGKCRIVPFGITKGIADSDTIRVRLDIQQMFPEFVVTLLHDAPYVKQQIESVQRGAVLGGLNTSTIANLRLAVPPLTTQKRISEHILMETSKFNNIVTSIEDKICLLREYRTRLIDDVVTGKLDVRKAAANLSDKSDEMEVEDDFEEETIEESLEEVVTEEMVEGEL